MQTCVVTLETMSNNIEGGLDLLYDSNFKATDEKLKSLDIDVSCEKHDNFESLTEGHIDIGEAVAEQLALEIDPFPRKLGVPFVQFSNFILFISSSRVVRILPVSTTPSESRGDAIESGGKETSPMSLPTQLQNVAVSITSSSRICPRILVQASCSQPHS